MADRDSWALADRYVPPALLAAVVAFMFWVRMRPADRVITDSAVYFGGNDAWYHKRMVELSVRHFPDTTGYDPWSQFPYGTGFHSGFGGLFDQLVALAALIVGLGNPSEHLLDVTLAVAPPVMGALTAIPTYVIAKRVTGRWTAVLAAALLALFGGGFLSRTIVGFSDHHVAEALFGAVAIAGVVYAIDVAYTDSPTFEDVKDRNWSYLRRPTIAAVLGGVALTTYLASWAQGVMLLSTIGVFVLVQLAREHATGRATDHISFAVVVTMLTTAVLTLVYARTYSITEGDFSLLQPLVAFGLAIATAGLFGLSRYAERERYDRRYYPPVVAGLVAVGFGLAWLVYPSVLDMARQLVVRIYSFGLLTSPSALTVREIHPATVSDAIAAFGLVFAIALVGLALMAYRVYRENQPVELLIIVWSLTMLSAYFTMARFGYYLAVNVAILAAYAIWWVSTRWLDIDVDVDDPRDVELYQVIAVLVIVLLILPGNVVALGLRPPVWDQSPAMGGTDQAWYDGMSWMEDNTPAVPLDYYEQYERPPDDDYEYPENAYGVMSWWDYGHWITVMGHRIPYANPFQEGPRPASEYLQTTNETRADLILDALPALAASPASVRGMSNEELRDAVNSRTDQQASENGRYVAIDDQMAGGKFPAITQWAGPDQTAYFQNGQYQLQGQNVSLPETSERYDRTMLARLYFQDAGGLSHYRLVHEVDRYSLVGGYVRGQQVRGLTSLPLNGNWDAIAPTASQIQRANQAEEAVQIGQGSYVYNARVESRVKLYERVEGATLAGSVPAAENGTPVVAYVRLQTDTGRNFTYVQQTQTDPDGSFELTVPYSTDDSVGTADGGTDSSVEAQGEYNVQAGSFVSPSATGTTAVPEEAIYEGRDIQVELEPAQAGEDPNGSAGAGNESTGSDDQEDGSDEQSGGSDNGTEGSVVVGRLAAPAES